jgi:hypothetical protein
MSAIIASLWLYVLYLTRVARGVAVVVVNACVQSVGLNLKIAAVSDAVVGFSKMTFSFEEGTTLGAAPTTLFLLANRPLV